MNTGCIRYWTRRWTPVNSILSNVPGSVRAQFSPFVLLLSFTLRPKVTRVKDGGIVWSCPSGSSFFRGKHSRS